MAHFYTEPFSLEEMKNSGDFSYSDSRVGKIPSVFIKIKKHDIFWPRSALTFFLINLFDDNCFYTSLQISADKVTASLCKENMY